jgi:MoaA/NifB/PqqE/SkfB family radical SAM enzyme
MSYLKSAITGPARGAKNLVLRELEMLKPRFLVLMTTDLCNSRCVTCNIWQNKRTHDPLSPEEIKRVLSDPTFQGIEYIINTGGESTTRQDLVEVFKAEHEALPNASLQLSTNALMPERALKVVEYCMENKVKLGVGVSMDGIGGEHDKIRGIPGNFEKADMLITRLVEIRKQHPDLLSLAIGTVLIDETIKNIPSVRKYAEEHGVSQKVQWYNNASFYGPITQEKEHQRDEILRIVAALPKNPTNDKWQKWLKGQPIAFTCFATYTFAVLKSNGDIVPCLTHWNSVIGNVRKSTPTEIWSSPEAKKVRAEMVKPCKGCVNDWGVGWSLVSSFYPYPKYYATHPGALKDAATKGWEVVLS